MSEFSLNHEMPNGASIADWLGTAASAARGAAWYIEDVRGAETEHQRKVGTARMKLRKAMEQLKQAQSEIEAVLLYTRGEEE
jgi:hypothetical protein